MATADQLRDAYARIRELEAEARARDKLFEDEQKLAYDEIAALTQIIDDLKTRAYRMDAAIMLVAARLDFFPLNMSIIAGMSAGYRE